MSLKLLHTGDVHLGAKFLKLGEKGNEQREQIKETFSKVIDLAIEEKVNALLIAGDLFDSMRPSEYSISFVKREIQRLSENSIWTIISPGTHDRLEPNSVFVKEKFTDLENKIYVFDDPKKNYFEVKELDTIFYANANLTNKSTKSPLSDIKRIDGYKYHVALAHGSYQIDGKSSPDDYPITEKDLENTEMNYVAVAHWHNTLEISSPNVKSYYCGSPELVALDQSGSGNVLIVEINDSVKVKNVRVGKRSLVNISIDLSSVGSLNDVIKQVLEKKDKNAILNLELSGFVNENVSFDESKLSEELSKDFFYVEIVNKSILDLKSLDSNTYPEEYLVGKFLKNVKESDLSEEDKAEIIKYGIVLFEGKDVL